MAAKTAIHMVACPVTVSTSNTTLMPSARTMFFVTAAIFACQEPFNSC